MARNPKPWRALSMALIACVVASCGSVSAQQAPNITQTDPQGQEMQAQDPLNLTQEQIQRLQTFMQRQTAQEPVAAVQERMQRLSRLLTAPTVDVQALTQHLEQDRDRSANQIDQTVAYWVEMRDILTEQQRAKLRQLIEGQPAAETGEFPQQLNLTDEQKQALRSLQSPQADQTSQRAIVIFMQDSDQAKLRDALERAQTLMPDARTVAAALASLTPQQRQQLFSMPEQQAGAPQQTSIGNTD